MANVSRLSYKPTPEDAGNNVLKFNADYQALTQGVTTDGNAIAGVSKIVLSLKKAGTPSGNLTIKLQTNNGGNPSGTSVTDGTSAAVAASGVTTSFANYDFTFSSPPTLGASTLYHIVLEASYAESATDYVTQGGDTVKGYTGGVAYRRDTVPAYYEVNHDCYFDIWGPELPANTGAAFLLNFI